MKYLFLNRTYREKVLVLAMIFVGLLIWVTLASDRLRDFNQRRASIVRQVEAQQVWLDNEASIRDRVEASISNLDPAQTLSGTRLNAEINRIAADQNLRVTVDRPQQESGEVLTYNTVVVQVSGAEMEPLIRFTQALQARAPYLGVEEIIISPDNRNPTIHGARYRISAVERRPAAN